MVGYCKSSIRKGFWKSVGGVVSFLRMQISSPYKSRKVFRLQQLQSNLPQKPGWYLWSTWGVEVLVYRKGRSKALYVKPPNGVEILIKTTIAGKFEFRRDI